MHPLAEKNKYVGMLFMKMHQEYFSLGRQGMSKINAPHVKELTKYNPLLSHVGSPGTELEFAL